jgi:hypothetical protein
MYGRPVAATSALRPAAGRAAKGRGRLTPSFLVSGESSAPVEEPARIAGRRLHGMMPPRTDKPGETG